MNETKFTAKFGGVCVDCRQAYHSGDAIVRTGIGTFRHLACPALPIRHLTFNEYLGKVHARFETLKDLGLRVGQTYFNCLYEERPDISEPIRGHPDLDPFYNDAKIPAFLVWVSESW